MTVPSTASWKQSLGPQPLHNLEASTDIRRNKAFSLNSRSTPKSIPEAHRDPHMAPSHDVPPYIWWHPGTDGKR